MTLIFANIGADLTNTSKVTSRKTKWPRFFLRHPVYGALELETLNTARSA